MKKEIEKIISANYLVGDAKEAANKIIDLLCKKVIMKDTNQPKHWDNWTIEKQLGYYLALKHLKQMILK